MHSRSLIIAPPGANIRKIKKWLYLGDDYCARSSIEKQLRIDGAAPVDIVKIHKDAADSVRNEFVGWIDSLNRRYGGDLEWWFGPVFSRNNYSSALFQCACYLEVLERLFLSDRDFPDVIFVESRGLARAIEKWALSKKMAVKVHSVFSFKTGILYRARALLNWAEFAVSLVRACRAAHISRTLCHSRESGNLKKTPFPSGKTVMIQTFVHDASISEGGAFTDSYFSSLYQYISKRDIPVIVQPVLYGFKYDYLSIFKRMRKSPVSFIVREDFLTLYDYLAALTYPVRSMIKRFKTEKFLGFDLSDVAREEKAKENFSSGINAVLTYRLFMRLAAAELNLSSIIQWYENQPADKALIAAARRYFPETKVVGAQLFLHIPNFLSYYPSQSEADAGLVPDILIETSARQCDIAGAFAKQIPRRTGAALRHAHLFGRSSRDDDRHGENPSILVLLPSYIPESIELLAVLSSAIEGIAPGVEIVVKSHPDDDPLAIARSCRNMRLSERLCFAEGDLSEMLGRAAVVISTSSGAIVEAAAYGIPVIYFGSATMLYQNILKDTRTEMVRECYSAPELSSVISQLLNAGVEKKKEYEAMGRAIRDTFFTPVNEETMSVFLNGER